jgi:hypothetical protein
VILPGKRVLHRLLIVVLKRQQTKECTKCLHGKSEFRASTMFSAFSIPCHLFSSQIFVKLFFYSGHVLTSSYSLSLPVSSRVQQQYKDTVDLLTPKYLHFISFLWVSLDSKVKMKIGKKTK